MLFSSWLRNRTSKRPADHAATSRPTARFRPQLESLDDRLVPSTLTVTTSVASGSGSLRDEINSAQSGDTIVFAPSLSGQVINLGSNGWDPLYFSPIELLIDKDLTIQGPGAGKLAIDADTAARVFEIAPGAHVAISGLAITGGNGTAGPSYDLNVNDGAGGGILNEGTLTLSGCMVTGNIARDSLVPQWGGGIANFGTMTMSSCTVSHNTAGYGGGVYNAGALTITGSTVTHNTAGYGTAGYGGGVYNAGELTISGSTVTYNTAGNVGGGVYNTGSLTVTDSTVTHNTAYYVKYDDLYNTGDLFASSSTIGNKKYK